MPTAHVVLTNLFLSCFLENLMLNNEATVIPSALNFSGHFKIALMILINSSTFGNFIAALL